MYSKLFSDFEWQCPGCRRRFKGGVNYHVVPTATAMSLRYCSSCWSDLPAAVVR